MEEYFKAILRSVWRWIAPQSFWRRKLRKLKAAGHEPEVSLLPILNNKTKTAIDVGAAGGVFSAHLLPNALSVIAFEPRPRQARELAVMASSLSLPIQVEAVALSDQVGTAQLRMLLQDIGRSTIEVRNELDDPDGSPSQVLDVPTVTLDSYAFDNVGFIKIDVEGHELSVLKGAQKTIEQSRCNLLIEAEERHVTNATTDLFDWCEENEYAGFFLLDGQLMPISLFQPDIHQDANNIAGWASGWKRTGLYINNFILIPEEGKSEFIRACNLMGWKLHELTTE